MQSHLNNRSKFVSPIWSLGLSLGLYGVLRLPFFSETVFSLPKEHFYIVSFTSLIAAGISFAVGISGVRLRNVQVLFVSLGFVSLSVMFSLHALSTPGFLIGGNRIVGVAVQLSFLLLSFFLWLSTIPGDNRLIAPLARSSQRLLQGWTVLLVVFSTAVFLNNDLIAWLPIDSTPLNWFVALVTIMLALIASQNYWATYHFTKLPFQGGIAHVASLVAVAQLIATIGGVWHVSWWLYHFILLLVVLITVFVLIRQFSFGPTFSLALEGLFSTDLMKRLEAAISSEVKVLITAVEAHDQYTAGHSQRVALSALRLGEKANFSPEELRALVQGSLLHDIGKLSIPDSVLNKPGKLNEAERELIETHPISGYEMCQKLGFMEAELAIIRWHHERINGRGYPDSISSELIPPMVRIVSVVDIYDALTSERSYRGAMTPDMAVKHLDTYSAFFLDEAYVELWKQILREDGAL